MPLTPQDVREKRFTPVRLREGYDMVEVDAFLDEVEVELDRLATEREELRKRAEGAPSAPQAATPVPTPQQSGVQAKPAAPPADSGPGEAPVADGTAGSRAARLLELATANADELVAEARAEAEALLAETRAEAKKLTDSARTEADALGAETERRRQELLGELNQQKAGLEAEVERLRTFEREYRSRLREYLSSHLATLDSEEADAVSLPSSPAEHNGRPQT